MDKYLRAMDHQINDIPELPVDRKSSEMNNKDLEDKMINKDGKCVPI